MFTSPDTQRIVQFLTSIGIDVRAGQVGDDTFLPGIQVDHGALVVDESRLSYPGDLLHEAGHLAVGPPGKRGGVHVHVGEEPAEEMMGVAWS